ncbi:hypothetical protein R6Q59_001654 [Mikania micrantha]
MIELEYKIKTRITGVMSNNSWRNNPILLDQDLKLEYCDIDNKKKTMTETATKGRGGKEMDDNVWDPHPCFDSKGLPFRSKRSIAFDPSL